MYIFFIVALTRLLACIFSDKMTTLLVALLVGPGINLATMIVEPLKRISAWMPMTYLNSVDIEIITNVYKAWAKSNKKALSSLIEFAEKFKVIDKVNSYLEILL